MLGALLLCAAATGVASAQDDGDQCAGPRCVSAARVDDFSIDSSAEYTSSNDPSGSGLSSFTINAGANGLLRISIDDGFYAVVATDSVLAIGESFSIDAPRDFGTLAGDYAFVTTGLSQPGTFGRYGLRMLRGPGANIVVERFTSAGASGAQDTGIPNPGGPIRVWIDRHDETTFRFYIGPQSARVFVFEDTLPSEDIANGLRVGVGAYNSIPTDFDFDNLSIACSPLSNACSLDATCSDTDPGYTCTCNTGFAGDGFACTEICGDGLIVGIEDCDPPSDQCCDATCFFEPNTTACTGASQGDACDLDASDHCEGTSIACIDVFQPDSFRCRPGSGDPNGSGFICDPDEYCTGTLGACPADAYESAGEVCNPGDGDPNGSGYTCDPDEVCPGTPGGACPPDSYDSAVQVCNPGSGNADGGSICDPDEQCPGTPDVGCPVDSFEPATTVCNAGDGDPNGSGYACDPDEFCPGVADTACPADVFEPATTVCNPGSGDPNGSGHVCDSDELCPGIADAGCPADSYDPSGAVCNPGSAAPNGGSICDPDEVCPGVADLPCPSDTVRPASVVCNPGSGNPDGGIVCDEPEYCSGTADVACPADIVLPADTPCREAVGECDAEEKCSGVADTPCAADTLFADATDCYTDPYIADPPNREPPLSALPCSASECQCSSGLCVEVANPLNIKRTKIRVSKPHKASGRVTLSAELSEGSIVGDLAAILLAGDLRVVITDADSSFSVLDAFPPCTQRSSQDRAKYKCRSAQGRITITSTKDIGRYAVRMKFKRLAQSETGADGLGGPVTAALLGTEFYRVDRAGSIPASECLAKDSGVQLLCGRNYPGPFVGY